MKKNVLSKIVSVLAAILLIPVFIASGFGVVAGIPAVTELVSDMTSDFDKSPYGYSALKEIAVEVRDYTINDYGRNQLSATGASNALAEFIVNKAREASSEDASTYYSWTPRAKAAIAESSASYYNTMIKLADINEEYGLTDEAISHLDDVNGVVSRAFSFSILVTILAIVCLVIGGGCFGSKCVAWALLIAGYSTIAIFFILEVWALVSFNSLFTVFHSLFFVDGTWTFSSRSLLLQMYPIDFWIDMGAIWFISSCVVALLCIITGIVLVRRNKKRALKKGSDSNSVENRSKVESA